ncbi:membrane protein [alpha proteobacterium U9-1i]|nr:membrane protein [alpha proteobacterium U9-1i]
MTPQTSQNTAPSALTAAGRVADIDLLRGLVMVVMALDHVRDYFHDQAFTSDPLNPDTTTPVIYFTRWITHICAPVFVFLAGVSVHLQMTRGKSIGEVSRLLLTRGFWLIFLEVTVLSFGWSFGVPWVIFLQVIWAIGWAMIALAGLVWLPRNAALAIGLIIVCGHNLLDPLTQTQFGGFGQLWMFLHEGGPIMVGGAPVGLAAYPILPWIGVIATGYGVGALFAMPPAKRDRILIPLALVMLALFFVLRFFNAYGNPSPMDGAAVGPFGGVELWNQRETLGAQIMVFMDVQKYPPSLQFLLVTLGVSFLMLPLLARLPAMARKVLAVFGAVPFFYYVLHIYLVHALAIAANAAVGRDASGMFNYLMNVFLAPEKLQSLGFSIGWVYVAWIAVVALLYPLCRWFAGVKQRRKDWWLSYL